MGGASRRAGLPPPTPGQLAFHDPFRVHVGGGMSRLHSMSPAPMHAVRAQRELPAGLSNRGGGGRGGRTMAKPAAIKVREEDLSVYSHQLYALDGIVWKPVKWDHLY